MTRHCVVEREAGLHARPARIVVNTVSEYEADVTVEYDSETARATSLLELTALGVESGTEIAVSATGPEAEAAVEAVVAVLSGKGET
ncbi:HPr family phosphocarrier protein [Halorussus halophilus]|uniref:HPr family phosphocarrier protein n=1 Tax=Halorussus halophilus TaxID=2650975 RepID=UPI0013014A9D|nr:HPr family phosphocarrier protein [Halorussus halophilus]